MIKKYVSAVLCLMLGACAADGRLEFASAPEVAPSCKQYSSQIGTAPRAMADFETVACEYLNAGKMNYRRGEYGLAEENFRRAAERFSGAAQVIPSPNYAEALLCLAATYDQLKRFDMADQSYSALAKIAPDTAVYNNNYGYSLLLRGETAMANVHFEKARKLDPTSAVIQNNIKMAAGI